MNVVVGELTNEVSFAVITMLIVAWIVTSVVYTVNVRVPSNVIYYGKSAPLLYLAVYYMELVQLEGVHVISEKVLVTAVEPAVYVVDATVGIVPHAKFELQ